MINPCQEKEERLSQYNDEYEKKRVGNDV